MAFSIYSRIPMPQISWKKENMKLTLVFFHLVGGICFALGFLIYLFSLKFSLSPYMFSSLIILMSFFVTGGIHIDGFMDSCDGIFSRKPKEEALSIMQDSSCGAFAVIGAILLFLAKLIFIGEIFKSDKFIFPFLFTFIFSRLLSGFSALHFKNAKNKGMLFEASGEGINSKAQINLIIIFSLIWLSLSCLADFLGTMILALSLMLVYFIFKKTIIKNFGGITGDLAGFLLEISEAFSFFALAIAGGMLK